VARGVNPSAALQEPAGHHPHILGIEELPTKTAHRGARPQDSKSILSQAMFVAAQFHRPRMTVT